MLKIPVPQVPAMATNTKIVPFPWPTDEMHKAGLAELRNENRAESVNLLYAYRAMIEAAPSATISNSTASKARRHT